MVMIEDGDDDDNDDSTDNAALLSMLFRCKNAYLL